MSVRTESRQVVVFSLGGERCAVPVDAISELISYRPPRPVVSAHPHTEGIITLHGTVVPVFDLAAIIGVAAGDPGTIVIVDGDAPPIGLTVTAVEEVLSLSDDQLEDAAISAVGKLDRRLIVVLNPRRLVALGERQDNAAPICGVSVRLTRSGTISPAGPIGAPSIGR